MRNKSEEGITLMALIITIIVLVILVAISISAAYNSGIIKFATQGAKEYAQAAIDENKIMEDTTEYIDSVANNIKDILGANNTEVPTKPELTRMGWFVVGETEPDEESKEVAKYYAKGQPEGTLIVYPRNGKEATIEYVDDYAPWDPEINEELAKKITSVYIAKGVRTDTCEELFFGLENCTTINLVNLDTHDVTNMAGMFSECYSLTNVDLSNLDTHSVIDMSYMFFNCFSLQSMDLSGLDTGSVTNMSKMFDECHALITSMTIMNKPERYDYVFSGCSNEPGAEFTLNYTSGLEDVAKKMIETANGNPNVKLGELKQ